MSELVFKSASELAQLIREKQVSSVEVVTAYLDRIAAVNPIINAVVTLVAESALHQAEEADASLAQDEIWGALHGVPMTIKDSFDTAGVVSTAGTLGRKDYVPKDDATVVSRLKQAGAILLGKTNTSELTLSFDPVNLIFGQTKNPYNPDRSPGGSSGGAAALVASGGTGFDVGTDYGGSVRLPAHFSGVAGIKPTSGRVPRTGHIIGYGSGAADAYQQPGPLARSVADLALLLKIIAGPDWRDPAIVDAPKPDPASVDLKSLRAVYFTDNGTVTPTAETVQMVIDVANAVGSQAASLTEDRPARLEETADLWASLHEADGGIGIMEIIERSGTKTEEISPNMRRVPPGAEADSREFGRRIRFVDEFRSQMLQWMQSYDVLICPSNAYAAIPHGTLEEHRPGFSYTSAFNITGWPAVVVRAGTSPEGLPLGVQIVAAPWREDIALAVAEFVEKEFGGWQRPPI